MKKNYNYLATPQSTPQFKPKRILHILSSTCLVINLIVFAILLPEIRNWTLGLAFLFLVYTLLQLFDKRLSFAYLKKLDTVCKLCYTNKKQKGVFWL